MQWKWNTDLVKESKEVAGSIAGFIVGFAFVVGFMWVVGVVINTGRNAYDNRYETLAKVSTVIDDTKAKVDSIKYNNLSK